MFICYIFTNHWLNHILKLSKSFKFYFYLSLLIDNAIWHAVIGMSYALKALLKSKSSTKNFSEFFSLTCVFRIILMHLNNVNIFFNCIQTKKQQPIYVCLLSYPNKKLLYFFFFALQIYFFVVVISRKTLVLNIRI